MQLQLLDITRVTQAEARARELLLRVLPTSVRLDFERNGWITVPSKDGVHEYRISGTCLFRYVYLHELDGACVAWYCMTPKIDIPFSDEMCAKYLLISQDEDVFLRIANKMSEESVENEWVSLSDIFEVQQLHTRKDIYGEYSNFRPVVFL